MPRKLPSKVVPGRELPEEVPGTPEQLLDIARRVIGLFSKGRLRDDAARLQHVADRLGHLGRVLLQGLQQQVTSPSAKKVEALLKLIHCSARALETNLASLPPYVGDLLNTRLRAQRRWDPSTQSFHPLDIGTAEVVTAVTATAAVAGQMLNSWRRGVVVGQVSPEQRGPMRAYQRIIGDPRMFVAEQVAQLVLAEQGTAAVTAEESGAVYTVVGELWEWATGLSDEEANLRKHVRLGVKNALLSAKLGEVERAIEDELTRYQASLTRGTPSEARREHKQRVNALRAEQDRLTLELLRSKPGQGQSKPNAQKQDKPGQ